jgi:hypothetical protein
MANQDIFQTKINQLSLVMTIPEDIIRACKGADMPPAITEIFVRLHNQQIEIEKAINELRSLQLMMADIVSLSTEVSKDMATRIDKMSKTIGYDDTDRVISEGNL